MNGRSKKNPTSNRSRAGLDPDAHSGRNPRRTRPNYYLRRSPLRPEAIHRVCSPGDIFGIHRKQDSDLAGVRDTPALAKLPENERKVSTSLWAKVANLLKEALSARPA
jgi:hypothetical protein